MLTSALWLLVVPTLSVLFAALWTNSAVSVSSANMTLTVLNTTLAWATPALCSNVGPMPNAAGGKTPASAMLKSASGAMPNNPDTAFNATQTGTVMVPKPAKTIPAKIFPASRILTALELSFLTAVWASALSVALLPIVVMVCSVMKPELADLLAQAMLTVLGLPDV